MLEAIKWISNINLEPKHTPHGSNFKTKLKSISTPHFDSETVNLISEYKTYYDVQNSYVNGNLTFNDFVSALNHYYNFCQNKSKINFVHQSDFYSSIVPEFLSAMINKSLRAIDPSNTIKLSAQADIAIEMNFDSINGGTLIEKKKRMDLATYIPKSLTFDFESKEFIIPVICFEVKTNLDKNMISGVETSSGTLKRTFPRCRYYLVAEYSDFDVKSQNYASTNIDEIIILRQQTRGEKRRLNKMNPISQLLLNELLVDVEECIKNISSNYKSLSNRMKNGRLSK